jgi:hypothetical protein
VKGVRYGTRVSELEGVPVPPLTESVAARAYREGSQGE